MTERRIDELLDKYPSLFSPPNNCDCYLCVENGSKPSPHSLPYGVEADSGWYDLLDETLKQLDVFNHSNLANSGIKIKQIKEKFGSLVIYYDDGDVAPELISRIDDVIMKARKQSSKICEICGSPGRECTRNGWYKTMCDKCANDDGYFY